MDNFNEAEAVLRSNISYPPKNIVKGSYKDCEDQVNYDSEENIKLDKIFSKVTRNCGKLASVLICQYSNNGKSQSIDLKDCVTI